MTGLISLFNYFAPGPPVTISDFYLNVQTDIQVTDFYFDTRVRFRFDSFLLQFQPLHHSSLSTVYGSGNVSSSNLNYPYHYEGGGARSMPVSPIGSNSRERLTQLNVTLLRFSSFRNSFISSWIVLD